MMAMLTVRNLPDEIHRALRIQAAHNGRSMEAEVRAILSTAVEDKGSTQAIDEAEAHQQTETQEQDKQSCS
ncbi:Plasmid stability protein [Nitrincola lacisaponensis]|uniref:Plasmid stability protein n=2 Tax=Nitrincola lacisaponensis TaxID=267850 RepID=A0A063Y8C7_9GAMM|nr:Plasmid stability protein [Nitrincola lacisaponensis]